MRTINKVTIIIAVIGFVILNATFFGKTDFKIGFFIGMLLATIVSILVIVINKTSKND